MDSIFREQQFKEFWGYMSLLYNQELFGIITQVIDNLVKVFIFILMGTIKNLGNSMDYSMVLVLWFGKVKDDVS